MQLLIDIYSYLSRLSPNISPQDSTLIMGITFMILSMFVIFIVDDGSQHKRLNKYLTIGSFIVLIGSPIVTYALHEPLVQGIEAPTYLKEQITNVKQSQNKHQIYTNKDNIELTFVYKYSNHKLIINDAFHIGERYYQDAGVSDAFDKFPSEIAVPTDTFQYDIFPIKAPFKDFDANQFDNTVYGYLTGTKNKATQTTRAMLQKENIHVIETEEARKHPEYASYQVSKIEATDETATATRNGQAKQVKIKNLYITLRKFISDKDRANMEADKKADDDKDVVNKLIN